MIIFGRIEGMPGLWFMRYGVRNVGFNEHGRPAMIVQPMPTFELTSANWNYVL